MDHVVISIQPFDFKQIIMIYQNGECKKMIPVTMNELSDAIVDICHAHDINEVDIRGEKNFTEKIKQEVLEKDLILYSDGNLKINLY